MDPAQNINQGPIYLEKEQPQEKVQNYNTNKSNPILKIVLAFLILIISLLIFIPLVFFLFNKKEPKMENTKPISASGEFKEFRKDFENSVNLKPISFLGYDNTQDYRVLNNLLNIDDVARIGCSNWENKPYNPDSNSGNALKTLNIVYGVPGRSDFWSASFIKEDLELNKTYYLPIYLDYGPIKYGRIYVFSDFKEFDSGSHSSMGLIKLNKFEGCNLGDEIEFEIDAILGQNEENEDIYYELDDESIGIQVIGTFRGKVNIENGKSAYDILIPQDEHKIFLSKSEETKKNRLERLKNEYIEEYGYDEEYDYFFDDYNELDEEDNGINNDNKRKSDVTQILNAIGAYKADNSSLPENITTKKNEIASDGIDLCDYLVETYIPALPADPDLYSQDITDCGKYYETGYSVAKDTSGKVTVSAIGETTSKVISVTR